MKHNLHIDIMHLSHTTSLYKTINLPFVMTSAVRISMPDGDEYDTGENTMYNYDMNDNTMYVTNRLNLSKHEPHTVEHEINNLIAMGWAIYNEDTHKNFMEYLKTRTRRTT